MIIREYEGIPEKVKVRLQKATENKSNEHAERHVFWIILHVDIDSDGHLTL